MKPPTSVKQQHRSLGMVQYYRGLWEKSNKLVAPLSGLISEFGHMKVTRAKKTKKKPWH